MIDPYKMVFVNIVASILLIAGTLFYKFIYPKKKINLFVLLLFVSILPILSILRSGDYESGDFNIHIYRIMSFYDSLKEGQLIPSWAAELNATYGNPLFIFNYSAPYYAISFFHDLSLSFITSMKLYLGIILYLSGIFMYMFVYKLTNNKLASFTSAIFYLFSPYHLIDVHFRATLGESTVFMFAPLLFYFITRFLKESKMILLIIISLVTVLMIMAHPLLSVTVGVVAGLFILFQSFKSKKYKVMFFSLAALLIGAIASSFMWTPFLIFAPYVFPNPTNIVSFYPFDQLFYSPFRYGFLFQGPNGELSLIFGYAQVLVVFISIFLLIRNKISNSIKSNYFFWVLIFLLLLFLLSPLSRFIWERLPLFWMLLPFGRLLLITSFCTSLIAGYFAITLSKNNKTKLIVYVVILFAIFSTILNWGHRRLIPEITDSTLRKNVWISTYTEGITAYFLNNKWADPDNFWFSKLPKNHLEITSGKAAIKEVKRTSIKHVYTVDAKTDIKVKENTLYFPGWRLFSNSHEIKIRPDNLGVITSNLPKGSQLVELVYEDIKPYNLSKLISIGMTSLLLFTLVFYLIKSLRLRSNP